MPQAIDIRCSTCKYYLNVRPIYKNEEFIRFQYFCRAYDRIPNIIISEKDLHAKVRPDQFGDFIFLKEEE